MEYNPNTSVTTSAAVTVSVTAKGITFSPLLGKGRLHQKHSSPTRAIDEAHIHTKGPEGSHQGSESMSCEEGENQASTRLTVGHLRRGIIEFQTIKLPRGKGISLFICESL